jgi:hypothetical protein
MEILVFPKILENTGSVWVEDRVILASGKISDKDGMFKLLCDSAKAIDLAEVEKLRRIIKTQKKNGTAKSKLIITLPGNADKEILKNLSQYFDRCNLGSVKVYLEISGTRLETPYCVNYIDGIEDALKAIVPEGQIAIF